MSAVAEMGGVPGQSAASVRREAWLRRLPLLPAFIYVVLVTQIPFALTVYYSFFSWNLLKDNSFKFAGLENYARLLTDESIRTAVWNTVLLTISVIGISVVLGLAVATLLNSEVFGEGFMRTLMMLIILAGLQSQNPEVLEAARVDGATAFQAFRRITLPLVRPFIELGALLGSLFVVQTFDSIFMLTHGGPGEDTTNIPFLLYLVAFQGFNIGQASAIGVVAVILTTIIATVALRTMFSIFQVEARR